MRVAPRQPEVLLAYAEALAEANDSRLAGRPVELLDALLVVEPGNLNGLWLRGMAAFQGADFPGALTPLGAPAGRPGPRRTRRQELTGLMEMARSKAGLTGGGGSVAGQTGPCTSRRTAPRTRSGTSPAPVPAAPSSRPLRRPRNSPRPPRRGPPG